MTLNVAGGKQRAREEKKKTLFTKWSTLGSPVVNVRKPVVHVGLPPADWFLMIMFNLL